MGGKVNLDALLPREDFEIMTSNEEIDISPGAVTHTLRLSDLDMKTGFTYSVLRKPDFQRETNEWDSQKICGIIENFLDGDLIPAIILWKNKYNIIFVLDGAHRLSSLIAWVNDDYGDGEISRRFYEEAIPDEQRKLAEKTREYIKEKVGTYKDHQMALMNSTNVNEKLMKRGRALGSLAIELQWVKGNADKAEESFFRINQKATKINHTELELLKRRKKPNSIAARAIIRSGTGHKYWSSFNEEIQNEIECYAKEINDILFLPQLNNNIKTLDLPIGGKGYSSRSLSLVFDSINIINEKNKEDDLTGEITLSVLKQCRSIFRRINSNHTSSLGLHPIVYFYSHRTGRYQLSSFMATIAFVMELEKNKKYNEFIEKRRILEEVIIENNYFIEQIISKYGSGVKSYKHIKNFFFELLEKIDRDKSINQLIKEIIKSTNFKFLKIAEENEILLNSNFSQFVKNSAYIKDALNNDLKCHICNGRIHINSIAIDHIKRKREGGVGVIENAQITHPYCNSIYKR
jgi:hypothetical protein